MKLNAADPEFVSKLRPLLPESAFREIAPHYLEEPRGRWTGQAGVVVAPSTVEEVAAVVRAASDHRVGVVPYGGGTGLVGGQVMPDGPAPVVLSLERMRAIRGIYPKENVMLVEAGAILSDIHAAAEARERLFPLTIAAKGSARIGGNLATNAGGVNVLRYGNARDLCLGLEAVLPNGDIWHGLKRLRKDNTGYDLKNLLIGSEGTLGVITAAALKLYPQPAAEGTALLVVESPEAALAVLALARNHLGEGVSAFELMHRMGLEFLRETLPDMRLPFVDLPQWFVLIDVGLARGLDPSAVLQGLFAEASAAGLVSDGMIAQSEAQRTAFWDVREQIPEANRRVGSISSHDISVPMGSIPEFIRRGGELLSTLGEYRINCFGHLGDGNLHYNVFPQKRRSRDDYLDQRGAIKHAVHELVHEFGGSVSAEHGIGRLKTEDLQRYTDKVKMSAMRAIKDALDPKRIMNPGAILEMPPD